MGAHMAGRPSALSVAGISSRKRPQVLCHWDVEEWPDLRVAFQDVRGRGPLYAKAPKLSFDREEALKQVHELWAQNRKLQATLVRLWNQHEALERRLIETEKYLEYLESGRGEVAVDSGRSCKGSMCSPGGSQLGRQH
jgi:hypothetical protein